MLNRILSILEDGDWHEIEEITRKIRISHEEVKEITGFLNKYGFAQVKGERRIKLNPEFLRLPI